MNKHAVGTILLTVLSIAIGVVIGQTILEIGDAEYRRDIIAIEEQVDAERVQYLQDSRALVVEQAVNGLITDREGATRMARLDLQEKAFRALRLAERKIRFMRIAGCTDDAETLVKHGLIRPGDVDAFAEGNYCEK